MNSSNIVREQANLTSNQTVLHRFTFGDTGGNGGTPLENHRASMDNMTLTTNHLLDSQASATKYQTTHKKEPKPVTREIKLKNLVLDPAQITRPTEKQIRVFERLHHQKLKKCRLTSYLTPNRPPSSKAPEKRNIAFGSRVGSKGDNSFYYSSVNETANNSPSPYSPGSKKKHNQSVRCDRSKKKVVNLKNQVKVFTD